MAKINILNKQLCELIAAGEVVERPASVVKELVENSIDAKATEITVSIQNGGITQIKIEDNGEGIDALDIPIAFNRHTTSKISCTGDLEKIESMGFRGEALCSIAMVSKVQLITKTKLDEFAYSFNIEGGEAGELEAYAGNFGTTLVINDLFFNTPARMKFLKQDKSEGNMVQDIMIKLALSYPEIAFKFNRDKKMIFYTQGDGKILSAVHSALSKELSQELVSIPLQEDKIRVTGYVSNPNFCKATRHMQYTYVNRRYVKNKTIFAALDTAYKGLAMGGRFPACVLNLEIPYEMVDVNVHPSKTEVRFSNDGLVFDAVYRSVKSAVTQNELQNKPLIFFDNNKKAENDTYRPQEVFQTEIPINTESSLLFSSEKATGYTSIYSKAHEIIPPKNNDICFDKDVKVEMIKNETLLINQPKITIEKEQVTLVGEVFKTYIIAQQGEKMLVIDKHAAHERILYEKLAKNSSFTASQQLLTPITLNVPVNLLHTLISNADSINDYGIELEEFGQNSIIIRALPSAIEFDDVEKLIYDLAKSLESSKLLSNDEKTESVLHSIACRGAIKAGDKSNAIELLALVNAVLNNEMPKFCPHGRPILVEMSKKELEKQFGRA